jgi:predicted metal-dependent phosphotriesterase family hydrolase
LAHDWQEERVRIETVTGPISPEELGATLMHEHVLTVAPGRFFSGGRFDDTADLAVRALGGLTDLGIGAVVDLTGRTRVDQGQDVATLRSVSQRTGLAVVTGVGLYKEPFPHWVTAADVGKVADYLVALVEEQGAGILGEIGSSLDTITAGEEKCLRSAAQAHLRTKRALSTHCTLGTRAREQVAILTEEGADLSRVIIGHLDLTSDVNEIEAVLHAGANVAFDTFGKEWFDYQVPDSADHGGGEYVKWAYQRTDADRIAALAELIRRGWDGQLVVSSDISGREAYLNPQTHGSLGYAYLPVRILPEMRAAGVTERSIQRLLAENPARILAYAP